MFPRNWTRHYAAFLPLLLLYISLRIAVFFFFTLVDRKHGFDFSTYSEVFQSIYRERRHNLGRRWCWLQRHCWWYKAIRRLQHTNSIRAQSLQTVRQHSCLSILIALFSLLGRTDKAVLAVNGFAADGSMFVKRVRQRLEVCIQSS